MPDDDPKRHEAEVAALLAIFEKLISDIESNDGQWETLEELMEARADFAIRHAFEGFGMTYDEAIELLKNEENLTSELRAKRDILVAAVDNLVDFSVAEEYTMAEQISGFDEWDLESEESSEEEELSEDDIDYLLALFAKYNDRYALVENGDIEYAMAIAAYLSTIKDNEVLMYMTMGDERVRPWHLQYEGYTAPKSSFPQWLIPPIEHQCRCYLVSDSASTPLSQVKSSIKEPQKPKNYNGVFKECVAMGGRIFSDEHSYFQIDNKYLARLIEISDRIKFKYLK